MIQISTTRVGPLVVATSVNDVGEVTATLGLTVESASRRLCRKIGGAA